MNKRRKPICILFVSFFMFSLAAASDGIPATNFSERNSLNVERVAERIENALKSITFAKSNSSSPYSSEAENATNSYKNTDDGANIDSEMTTDFDFITVYETTGSSESELQTAKHESLTLTETTMASPNSEMSTTEVKQSPFTFTLLRQRNPSSTSRSTKTTMRSTTTTTQATEADTTDMGFITVFETTNAVETLTGAENKYGSNKRMTTKAQKTAYSRPGIEPGPRATRKTSTHSGRKYITTEHTVFEIQNGMFSTMKETAVSSTTKRPRTTQSVLSKKVAETKYEMPTVSPAFEEFTTRDGNAGVLLGASMAGGIPGLPGLSMEDATVEGGLAVADVVLFLHNPAKFWSKYWYWILVVLILIIVLFLIPGFICQIYLSRWCRERRLERFFEKKSHPIFDFERIGFGFGRAYNKSPDIESGSSGSFSSAGYNSDSPAAENKKTALHPTDRARSRSSLTASVLTKEEEHSTKRGARNSSKRSALENRTVIVIPDPASEIRSQGLSPVSLTSNSIENKTSFGLPETSGNASIPPTGTADIAASIYSLPELGVIIGKETIIKSSNLENRASIKQLVTTPSRPPKPEHMKPISNPTDLAPSNRPQQRSPISPKRDQKLKHRSKDVQRRRRKTTRDRTKVPKHKEKSRKLRPSTKENKKDDSKEIQATTRSIIKATQSLEDILEAITKLTKEYPIPDLPEMRNETVKKDGKRQRRRRAPNSPNKVRKDREVTENFDRYLPDEEMLRRKEKRTKNWANEQRKLEREKDRKKLRRQRKDEPKPRQKKLEEKTPRVATNSEVGANQDEEKKIPTLKKEKVPDLDRTKQERSRMRLERDLKKLQKYHNKAAKKYKQPVDDPK